MEAHGIACAADGRASAGYGGIAALVLFGDFAQNAAGNARGEYMVYTNGKIYKCLSDTVYSPEEYAAHWEIQK